MDLLEWVPGRDQGTEQVITQFRAAQYLAAFVVEPHHKRDDLRRDNLRLPIDRVAQIPPTWAVALRSVRGVYLLVHRKSGDQYVGAAYGRSASAYDASILEIVGSDATVEDVCQRETLWKTKLGSRAKGLNRN